LAYANEKCSCNVLASVNIVGHPTIGGSFAP
jgi:hypothetical protein